MRHSLPTITLSFLALLGSTIPGDLRAETPLAVAFPSFDEGAATRLEFVGDATVNEGEVRLTRDVPHVAGRVFNKAPIALQSNGSFSAYFSFQITTPLSTESRAADGLAFVLQPYLKFKQTEGRDIGYAGSGRSLAIEFDTFYNGDVDEFKEPHVGLSLNGHAKSLISAKLPFAPTNGPVAHVWVDYDGATNLLEVRVSDSTERPATALLSRSIVVSDMVGTNLHVGFSAATGAGHQQHSVKSFFFQNALVDQGLDPSSYDYVQAPAQ